MAGTRSNSGKSQFSVPNLERAMDIIEYLAKRPEGRGQSELAEEMGIPKNSVYRITMTLLDRGYLDRNELDKRFTLSQKFLAIGYHALCEESIVLKAAEPMQKLRDEIGETVLLGTMLDNEGVVIHQVSGSHPFRFVAEPGTRFCLHTSAPGKAIIAFLPEPARENVIRGMKLKAFNDRTITTKEAFRKELEITARRQYSIDRAEQYDGVYCVGAPVFDLHGYPIASVWGVGPKDRMPEEKLDDIGKRVRNCCLEISGRMGYGLIGKTKTGCK